ncbi:polymer-forming cytoskeletal protein [Alphaproteobacteria bacterium]|nr:polymer-forming cytoskeletal protein [Alphaproteobacteria bacterium]
MANKQAVLGAGARFSGKISNAKSIEINGYVDADLVTEKVTIGSTGKFLGKVDSELVVIAGEYEGKMKADSVWLTESSRISGEVHYKSLQMDRGAALNCRVVHNWNENDKVVEEKNQQNVDGAEDGAEEGQPTKK